MASNSYAKYTGISGGSGGGSAGVSSLNSLTGDLTLVAGTGISVTPSGSNITIAATGSGANTTLSNLTSPTAVNQDLLPSSAGSNAIGEASAYWASVHAQEYDFYSAGGALVASLTSDMSNVNLTAGQNTGDLFNITGLFGLTLNAAGSIGNVLQINADLFSINVNGANSNWPNSNAAGALTNDGSGNLSWTASGGGFTPEFHLSAACATSSSAITGTSFTTFSNSPTLSFTATNSGTYVVSSSPSITYGSGSGGNNGYYQVVATSGTGTVLAVNGGVIYCQGISFLKSNAYVYTVISLIAGNAYTFDLQAKVDNGADSVYLDCSASNQTFIYAQRVS